METPDGVRRGFAERRKKLFEDAKAGLERAAAAQEEFRNAEQARLAGEIGQLGEERKESDQDLRDAGIL